MPRITDVCSYIHRNEPPIRSLYLSYRLTVSPQFCGVELCYDHTALHESNYDIIEFSKENIWSQIGQAIGRNPTLSSFSTFGGFRAHINHTTAQTLAAIYDGLKENRSIQELTLALLPNEAPIFDLHYFVRNNHSLKSITLSSPFENQVQQEQTDMITEAVDSCSLNSLDISECCFGNDGSQEQILYVCQRVRKLKVTCKTDDACNAVAALLRDPRAVLNKLELVGDLPNDSNGMTTILSCLSQNNKLQGLDLLSVGTDNEPVLNIIGTQLCDTSSIESIQNSNHFLKRIRLSKNTRLPEFIQDCLELNKNENKHRVIRQKIAKHFFIGEFNMSPLANMHISLFPRVMSMINESHRQSAVFRMLKSIPDLCKGFDKDVGQEYEHKQSNCTPLKRKKKD
eukprot:scaffold14569_cov49-Cyclotella_meneghiniana.AAC.8